jgi:hypothetical protein
MSDDEGKEMNLVGIPFSQLGSVHQYASISASSTGRVFYLKIPDSCVGFIYKVGTSPFQTDTYLALVIDGMTVEKKIERMNGSIDTPVQFNDENGGPYLVKDYVEFTATNNSNNSLTFNVCCDGVCYSQRKK